MNDIEKILKLIEKQLLDFSIDKEILATPYIWEKYKDPLKVLITIIFSIRVREEVTIKISEKFFEKYKNLDDIRKASLEEIENEIRMIGLYKNKARWIKEISNIWDYNKCCDEDFIRSLPGVGRKVANLYLSVVCNKDYIAVDTHVHRVLNRIGVIDTKDPNETEEELYNILPKEYYSKINFILVRFGRNVCKPINPKCELCYIKDLCKYYKSSSNRQK